MIAVMLVGGQRLSREGIGRIISTESDMEVVGTVSRAAEAFSILKENKLDVVLLNLHLLAMEGIKLMAKMLEQYRDLKIILVTDYHDQDLVFKGIMNGAHGFLSKNIDGNHMVQLIRYVHDGQIVISGKAAQILAEEVLKVSYDYRQILGKKLEATGIDLTERELDTAYLLKQELTNKEIAKQLFLSEGTIKNYISDIYSKLRLHRRGDVIEYLNSFDVNSG